MAPSTTSRPVVLITGAASGIGAATAEAFASREWIVYATDITPEFPSVVEARCRCLELDVTDSEQCQQVADRVIEEADRIDVLVNNAGFAVPGPVEDVSVEASRRQFDVIVHGVHAMTQAVLPAMRERGEGRIVMVSSVLGVSPSPGLGTYGAAKAAVESLSDSLRIELSQTGISVSLIEPAWVDTDFSKTATSAQGDERTPAYSETYEMLDDGWVVEGGPLATSPQTVAETILEAATVEQPATRYPVGIQSRLAMANHWMPDRLRDSVTRRLLRWTVPMRRHWESLFDRAGFGSPSADSTVRLSTGQTVSVPLQTHASVSGVVLSAATEAVEGLLPEGLGPLRLTPTRSAVTIMSIEYETVADGAVEPYNEVAIIVPAVQTAESRGLPLISALSATLGGYIWQLPVTTEPAVALGREIWGYPKSVADIEISTEKGVTQTRLSVEGDHALSLAVGRPPTRFRRLSLSSYTLLDGQLCRTDLTFAGQLGVRPLSTHIDWAVGDHPWGQQLAALDTGSRAVARFGGDCAFTIGPPQLVETD